MLNLAHTFKTGSLFKGANIGTVPVAASAGTRNGSAINRRVAGLGIAQSLSLIALAGAATGTPASLTLDAKIQDSADGSTAWADYIPPDQTTVSKVTQMTAASSVAEVDVNLSGAKQYVRVVEVLAFVGGTTPTLAVATAVTLAGFDQTPA